MTSESPFASLPEWVFRVFKLSPWHYHDDRQRWESRTYPCSRWHCFRRSPAWRSYERRGRSWCDRHVPWHASQLGERRWW